MALVFGIEVSCDNTLHKLTSRTFTCILGSTNICVTVSTRQNAERRERGELVKKKKNCKE